MSEQHKIRMAGLHLQFDNLSVLLVFGSVEGDDCTLIETCLERQNQVSLTIELLLRH